MQRRANAVHEVLRLENQLRMPSREPRR
jgi:hypothetical protein